MVRGLALLEEGPGSGSPMDAGQGEWAAHEVSADSFDADGVRRPDGGSRIDGETAFAKRGEKLDAFLGEKSFALEQAKDFVSPELFGGLEAEVGHGEPLSLLIPNASRSKAVDVRMWIKESAKSLRHGDDAGPSVGVGGSFGHQLLDGFIGETREIGEKLSVPPEITRRRARSSPEASRRRTVFDYPDLDFALCASTFSFIASIIF